MILQGGNGSLDKITLIKEIRKLNKMFTRLRFSFMLIDNRPSVI